jgi:hypothetical protein
VTSLTSSPWKAFLHCTTLKHQRHFYPPAASKAACMKLQKFTGEHHTSHTTPLPSPNPIPPLENNPVQPLGRLNPPKTKLKAINSEMQSSTNIRGGDGTLHPLWTRGSQSLTAELSWVLQGTKLSALNSQ